MKKKYKMPKFKDTFDDEFDWEEEHERKIRERRMERKIKSQKQIEISEGPVDVGPKGHS